uniref:Uncharacterized protein n=1 Tax=Candidatus Kentrum eta TaxID=2126337 RepID=A0A450VIX1_9GAMM|nr:MAG: hypothetical protein BECKH772C_GA0070978_102054 [Candidatus Kentron sp. H]
MTPGRRDGGENKDCSGLHDAQAHNKLRLRRDAAGRNSGAAAVDCEFPNSFFKEQSLYEHSKGEPHPLDVVDVFITGGMGGCGKKWPQKVFVQ